MFSKQLSQYIEQQVFNRKSIQRSKFKNILDNKFKLQGNPELVRNYLDGMIEENTRAMTATIEK